MPRTNRPTSVTPSGPRHGVDEELRQCVDEAFADLSPNVLAQEVFKRLRSHHARRVKARQREKT
jgi:hypothetical protein